MTTLKCLKCLKCDNPARWHIWYMQPDLSKSQSGLGYNSYCDEHAKQEMDEGRAGFQVTQISLIDDSLLPDDDRAKKR